MKKYYALGQAGFSTKLLDDGKTFMFGAPGISDWKGSVGFYEQDIKKGVMDPDKTSEIRDYEYFGYAVGIGKFSSNKSSLYDSGAPRGGSNCAGNVRIFNLAEKFKSIKNVFVHLNGTQSGEYFGSVIETVDINKDGLADLLIGAPMYTYSSKKHDLKITDQGRVYVYMNRDNGIFEKQKEFICGSSLKNSRFGSTISAIGDINNDHFVDVAIGSPYEDNGKGAVYIYFGSENGLNPKYVQRIVLDGTQGFGISISKGVDIDKNTCNGNFIESIKYDYENIINFTKSSTNYLIENVLEHSNLKNVTVKSIYLNCSNKDVKICMEIKCMFKNISVGSNGVRISIKMQLNADSFEKMLNNKLKAVLSTYPKVQQTNNKIVYKYSDFAPSNFIMKSQELPDPASITVYFWGFAVGIVFLLIFSFILYKIGFFKRKENEELELLKNQNDDNEKTEN